MKQRTNTNEQTDVFFPISLWIVVFTIDSKKPRVQNFHFDGDYGEKSKSKSRGGKGEEHVEK